MSRRFEIIRKFDDLQKDVRRELKAVRAREMALLHLSASLRKTALSELRDARPDDLDSLIENVSREDLEDTLYREHLQSELIKRSRYPSRQEDEQWGSAPGVGIDRERIRALRKKHIGVQKRGRKPKRTQRYPGDGRADIIAGRDDVG